MLSKLLPKRIENLFRTIFSALVLLVKPASFIKMLHLLIFIVIWILLLFFLILFAAACFLTERDKHKEGDNSGCPFEQTETSG